MSAHKKIQTIPTTMVTGYWDCGSVSEIPEEIKIVMANGKRAVYRLHVEQPSFRKSLEIIRNMKDEVIGYQRK